MPFYLVQALSDCRAERTTKMSSRDSESSRDLSCVTIRLIAEKVRSLAHEETGVPKTRQTTEKSAGNFPFGSTKT